VLGVHLGQHLIEMRLAQDWRPIPRAQRDEDRAADEFLDVRGRYPFGRRDHRGRFAVEHQVTGVEPQQLFPAHRVRPGDLDREVHPARPVGEGVL
jgi:hypothetical protein